MQQVGLATPILSTRLVLPAGTPAYSSGQGLWQSATAGSCTPLQFELDQTNNAGEITEVRLYKSGTGVSGSSFRVHFFLRTFTIQNGDNAALSITPTDITDAIGRWDVTVDQAYTGGAFGVGVPTAGGSRSPFRNPYPTSAGAYSIYAAIEARGAYTRAASEVFRVQAFFYRAS